MIINNLIIICIFNNIFFLNVYLNILKKKLPYKNTLPCLNLIVLSLLFILFKYKKYLFFYFNFLKNFFKVKLLIFFKKKNIFFSRVNNLKKIISKKVRFKNKFRRFKKRYFFKNNQIIDNKFKFLSLIINNRKIIKNIFFKKFTRQKKITKFIINISKKNNYLSNRLYNFLFVILIQSQFFFFIKDVDFFLKNKFIYVNNKNISKKFFEVKINDYIRVIKSKSYYRYIIRIRKFFKKKISKIKYRQWLSYKLREKNIFKRRWLPNFLNKFLFYKYDIPKYLEVDFFSLTVFYLYSEKNIFYKNRFFFMFISFYMIRTYNWKKLH